MKREEPHCKAVRLFPLVEHRGSVWLTCGGRTATPDELYSLCFGIFDSVLHSTYTRDFMIGYIFSSFRYANYTKSSLRFASDLQQCLHQFRICWQNDESSQHRTVRYEQKLHNQMAQSKYPQPSDLLVFHRLRLHLVLYQYDFLTHAKSRGKD